MAKVPDEAPIPFPKYNYHYSEIPNIRMSNERIMSAIWDNKTVVTRSSYNKKHLLVGETTLCGIEKWRCEESSEISWESSKKYTWIHKCARCERSMSLITDYLLKCEQQEAPSD